MLAGKISLAIPILEPCFATRRLASEFPLLLQCFCVCVFFPSTRPSPPFTPFSLLRARDNSVVPTGLCSLTTVRGLPPHTAHTVGMQSGSIAVEHCFPAIRVFPPKFAGSHIIIHRPFPYVCVMTSLASEYLCAFWRYHFEDSVWVTSFASTFP